MVVVQSHNILVIHAFGHVNLLTTQLSCIYFIETFKEKYLPTFYVLYAIRVLTQYLWYHITPIFIFHRVFDIYFLIF